MTSNRHIEPRKRRPLPVLPIIAVGAGAAGLGMLGYVLLNRRSARVGMPILPAATKPEPLSARRQFVLDAISQVVPSQYGDAKFKKIAPNYDPDDPNLPRNAQGKLIFTTCGYLPCYVGNVLKAPHCITQGGLNSMRDNGRAMGAWVDAIGSNRPRPGDLYGIGSPKLITHVGVVIDASDDAAWKTADAGQGTVGAGQRAAYNTRPYDPKTNTISGIGTKYIDGKGWSLIHQHEDGTTTVEPRTVAGWFDIDKAQGATP